jgi:tagaturonate reductase
MKSLCYDNFPQYAQKRPERIIQFGEGNFLRGFIDWMIHQLNKKELFNGSVVAIQPTPHGKVVPKLNAQDGLYTMVLRGVQEKQVVDQAEVITSISRGINPYTNWSEVLKLAESKDIQFVFSNTTEAGLIYSKEEYAPIQSPLSFPGKLTAFLFRRFQAFGGSKESGMTIFPCELVEDNGDLLKSIVNQIAKDWDLPAGFIDWVETSNLFCNTLVDRIVTGYPKDNVDEYRARLGYDDQLLTVGEPYHLFAIEGDATLADILPFHKVGLNVHWAPVKPFRELKVRLLNGAHTLMVPVSYLAGKNTVQDVMEDEDLRTFVMQGIDQEIFPFVDLDIIQKKSFADSVIERFLNPYNKHFLLDISLNSIYKFRTRLIPSLLDYVQRHNSVPASIAFSLSALIYFYRGQRWEGNAIVGDRAGELYLIRDQQETLGFFLNTWSKFSDYEELAGAVLSNQGLWGMDLNGIQGLQEYVGKHLMSISESGMQLALLQLLQRK